MDKIINNKYRDKLTEPSTPPGEKVFKGIKAPEYHRATSEIDNMESDGKKVFLLVDLYSNTDDIIPNIATITAQGIGDRKRMCSEVILKT